MSWDWSWLTPLGHVAVVWPLMVAVALLLVARPSDRADLHALAVWFSSMAAASLLVAASKVAFYGWGTGIRHWNLTCFSGHSVLATGFWPVTMALLVPPRFPSARRIAWMLGAATGVLVGISRVKLNAHPASEVLAGLALGLAVATLSFKALGQSFISARTAVIATGLIALLCTSSGIHLPNMPTERWLANLGARLSGNEKPVRRDLWSSGDTERRPSD